MSWIPLVSIIIIVIMRSGTYSAMYILLNELYPTEIRTQSIALTETICLAIGKKDAVKKYPQFIPFLREVPDQILPTSVKAISRNKNICFHTLAGATSLKLYPDLKHLIYDQGVFLIYAVMGLICALWGVFTMPDNRGKSLVKVEELYE